MAISTKPATRAYLEHFEEMYGRRCFYCHKPLDKANEKEWTAEAHEKCELERVRSASSNG